MLLQKKFHYIQFKVTEETLEKIVTATKNEDVEDLYNQASSKVDANAYHTYTRNDSNWRDNTQKTYTHKTVASVAIEFVFSISFINHTSLLSSVAPAAAPVKIVDL